MLRGGGGRDKSPLISVAGFMNQELDDGKGRRSALMLDTDFVLGLLKKNDSWIRDQHRMFLIFCEHQRTERILTS